MRFRSALFFMVVPVLTSAGGALAAAQGALQPRQVAIEWLTAKTVADALRHLPPSTLQQFRVFQKTATPEREAIVNMVEPMMAPLVFSQLMGGTLTTAGKPVSTIVVSGAHPLHLTVLNASITGEKATVPLRVRSTAGGAAAAGAIELRRDAASWRIVAADLGPAIQLARFDSPDYMQAAMALGIEQLKRERVSNAVAMMSGRLRAFMSAQLVFAAFNAGFFAPPECLTDVAKCKTPSKLDSAPLSAGTLDLEGYTSRFYPGPRPSASEISLMRAAPQSLKSWAHVFSPTQAASQVPALCADSTGRVCRLRPGQPQVTGGVCPATCADVK